MSTKELSRLELLLHTVGRIGHICLTMLLYVGLYICIGAKQITWILEDCFRASLQQWKCLTPNQITPKEDTDDCPSSETEGNKIND